MAQPEIQDSSPLPDRLEGSPKKASKRMPSSPTQQATNASWLVGDVVWSKIPGHPWWPSMVSYDPNSAVYFQLKGRARYYHVQFFGQDPVRGWASERSVIKFEGREKFEGSIHNKNHRVTAKRLPMWETAVKVGEKALPMNRHERQLCFTFKYYDKHKEHSPQRIKGLNGINPVIEPPSPTKLVEPIPLVLDRVSDTSLDELNPVPANTEENKDNVKLTKVKTPRKRKRKVPEIDNMLPTSSIPSPGETATQCKATGTKEAKRVRKPKKKDFDVPKVPPPQSPLQNGEIVEFPINGALSPSSALKLKIRKVKSPVADRGKVKRKRGRPRKEKETFIIVNVSDKPSENEAEVSQRPLEEEQVLPDVVDISFKPDVSSTCLSSAEEKPSKRKRRKLENKFVTDKETGIEEKLPTVKRKYVRKTKANKVNKTVDRKTFTSPEVTDNVEPKLNVVSSSADILENKQPKKVNDPVVNGLTEVEGSVISSNDGDTGSSKGVTMTKKEKAEKEREAVCVVCEQVNDLIFCEGSCNDAYHPDCIGLSTAPKGKFICDECTSGIHSCFVCRQTGDVKQCNQPLCSKYYHIDCLKGHSCAKIDGERIYCPLHSCITCVVNKTPTSRGRLIRCVRCPTSYHLSGCLVAGCMPITSHLMVCAKHFMPNKNKAHHSHVNVNWCFVCSIGGTLICCESCPAAFHPECISYEGIPEGHFFCKDCTDDKALLYGDIVWVKLGMYRWWPAQICNPREVPTNIQSMRHQPGEFPVMFLGSHDYYWIHKGRVFSYQDGDKGTESGTNKYLAKIFKKALDEAKEKYAEWKKARDNKAEQDLQKLSKKPAPFKHVKVNKCTTAQRILIDPNDMPICECLPLQDTFCGPDSNCLNRMLQFECTPKCPAGEKCLNQRYTKREYADLEPFRALARGWGLRTRQDVKKGCFVIEYVGELIDESTCLERVKKGDDDTNYYMLTIDKDCIIDAGPMGNLSRFMNHSCNPNCETQKWTVNGDVRVGLFASRDINGGDEITFDYRLDCRGNEKKKCNCGAENCSGFLGVRPKTQNAQLMEDRVKKAAKNKKKRQKKVVVKEVHEDECFICGDGGQLIMCDKNGCSKCYHVDCLELQKHPPGKWLCPWHFCDDCGKRATIMCAECPNSFCKHHAEGQILCLGNGQYLCDEHKLSEIKKEETSLEMDQLESLDLGEDLPDVLPEITTLDFQDLPQDLVDLAHTE